MMAEVSPERSVVARILLIERGYKRIRDRLADVGGALDVVVMRPDGTTEHEGADITLDDARPEIGWVGPDAFSGPVRDYVIAMLKSPDLRWVQSGAAGYDHPMFRQLVLKGARLTTTHVQGIAIAEYVVASVLDHFQRGPERRQAQAEHRWVQLPYREVHGSTWLVVGFGSIGQEVARRARGFGAVVVGVRRNQDPHELADRIVAPDDVAGALPSADVVVLCAPLTAQTEGMVDAGFLAAMKPGSVLVNVGRGPLVDEAALLAALDLGTPEQAILDVFHNEPLPPESPFWDHPRVRLTGHASAYGSGVQARGDALFLDNLHRYFAGQPLLGEVSRAEVTGE
jgi:phosphoglycerate dehydrogenase-like enzyme